MKWIQRTNSDYTGLSDETYSLSISDLMTSLLIIFILTLAYYMLSFSQATARLQENIDTRNEILKSIQKELKDKGITVEIDLKHGVLRLPEGILFDEGRAVIKEEGRQVIQMLGPILFRTLNKYSGNVETVFIEGHTDNTPIGRELRARFPSNWELSTQRAINTWRAIFKASLKLENLKNKKREPLFSCSGYADTRPVSSNDTVEGRMKNRRIDLRFSMTPPRKEKEPAAIQEIRQRL
jgi:flagellar motor protein MotB